MLAYLLESATLLSLHLHHPAQIIHLTPEKELYEFPSFFILLKFQLLPLVSNFNVVSLARSKGHF